jgi:hypothetical protein
LFSSLLEWGVRVDRQLGLKGSIGDSRFCAMVLAGSGDQAAMVRHCQARADRDADLTHLVMHEGDPNRRSEGATRVFPADEVRRSCSARIGGCGGSCSAQIGRLWRVEVGVAAEESEQERERFAPPHRPGRARARGARPHPCRAAGSGAAAVRILPGAREPQVSKHLVLRR